MRILRKIIIALLGFAILVMVGCTNSAPKNQFKVSDNEPAVGLTFGWYLPDSTLQDLIGPRYTPKIMNDKGEGVLMFSVALGDKHQIAGKSSGSFSMAGLLIPVLKVSGLKESPEDQIETTYVSPLTILAEGKELHEKMNEKGFAMVGGTIDISIKESGDDFVVEATVTTSVGKNEMKAIFENLPVDYQSVTAVINPASAELNYFYGREHAQRFENGKGYVKSEGNTFYSGLGLLDKGYFITLSKDFYWEFYFEGE